MPITRVSAVIGKDELILETGHLAKQAGGAVLVRQGGTVVLVAATANSRPTDADFFPLTCDYRERTYAAGKIPGGFFKREGRPTEKETLTSRLIDRPIRPLFPKGFAHEVQVVATVLSADGEYDADVLAMVGASASLKISNIPFPDALGAVRIASLDGQFVVNPTFEQLTESELDLVVAGTSKGITMVEAGQKEVSEDILADAIEFGYEEVKKVIALQESLTEQAGKTKDEGWAVRKAPEAILEQVRELAAGPLKAINDPKKKAERKQQLSALKEKILEKLTVDESTDPEDVSRAFEQVEWEETRLAILEEQKRVDGRDFTTLRDITCEVSVLPRTHGSSVFTRGETQSLSVTTLGTVGDEQTIETLEGKTSRRFMLHYNFPSYSVGETRPNRGPGRREIGHGALAERSLLSVIPAAEDFPYTIRLVSEVLESNGSSSMATVCAGTLALLDAGVPIKAPVSGVAMGLVKGTRGSDKTAVLTDISGLEDHIGDMDFKVAGTRNGTTALQVDVKLQEGLTMELIRQILKQSHTARMEILDKIDAAISAPRTDLSAYAPRITILKINPDKIRDVIGSGGKTIRRITEETGAQIDIDDDGTVHVASSDAEKAALAIDTIKALTSNVEIGKIYKATVKRVVNFGCFCEFLPGKEGLVHVSELDDKYVDKVEDVVKVGDTFDIKVIEVDKMGRVNLSRKQAMASKEEDSVEESVES